MPEPEEAGTAPLSPKSAASQSIRCGWAKVIDAYFMRSKKFSEIVCHWVQK